MVKWTTPSGAPCDADLDLYVVEIGEAAYAPWMGQATPNGSFSPDSAISGVSEEYYQANASVQAGYYDFFAQYYADGSNCNRALVELFFNGTSLGSAYMDLSYGYHNSNDAYGCDSLSSIYDYLNCLNDNYTDYVYLGYVEVDEKAGKALLTERKWSPFESDTAKVEALKTKLQSGKAQQ
jgi:hypothetical protein